jgi:hypothetical protein
MLELVIESLYCDTPSDWEGVDECRLEVFIDGSLQKTLSTILRVGQIWALNQAYLFEKSAKIMLWEEDWPDKDDILSEIVIDDRPVQSVDKKINTGRGRYKLTYSVTVSQVIARNLVEDAIEQFKQNNKAGIWKHIQKQALIDDVVKTTTSPLNVNQAGTPLCGPAAIVYELASKFPRNYVELCQELFENGKFQARTMEVVPSNLLVNSPVKNGVSISDWMLMATLRDTENEIFHVEACSNVFVMGFTTPAEMKGWTFELLGYTHADYAPLYFFGEFDALRKAKRVIQSGGVAFLMINSVLLTGGELKVSHPDHWVSIDAIGPISSTDNVKLTCYSWGKSIPLDVPIDHFEKHTWGIVYGIP